MYSFDPYLKSEFVGLQDSFLSKLRKKAKKIARPVTKVTEKILKPIAKPLRPVGAAAAVLTPVGLVVQPKILGIKSKKSQKIFSTVQKGGRIVAVAAATVVTAGAIAPAVTSAGAPVLSKLAVLKGMGVAGVTKLKNFFVSSGVGGDAAKKLAEQVLAGQRPVPDGMYFPEAEQQAQAGMMGFDLKSPTTMFLGMSLIGGIALFASQGGGKRRGRRR